MNARGTSSSGELPPFTKDGLLPLGDYALTLDGLRSSPLVLGPTGRRKRPTWDAEWRLHLVDNLSVMAHQLWQVGITDIFIDGSFVEEKDHPNDIDGYFDCDLKHLASRRLERELNELDPWKVWTWSPESRRKVPGFPKRQLPMWIQYRVELFPHYGQLSGIRDPHGYELEFPAAFRLTREGLPKGIIRLIQ